MDSNVYTASENKVFRCKIDGNVYGKNLTPGLVFYKNGGYIKEGIFTTIEDFEEIWQVTVGDIQVTSDAKTYEQFVTDAIRAKYTLDEELALNANLRLDAEKYAEEDRAFQEWRTKCKVKAKELYG